MTETEAVSSSAKVYQPYFPPSEVAYLIQQNAGKLPPAKVEALRQVACGLMDRIGGRLGFPRRTIATAQLLYHRFHLYFPLKDFAVQDVSIACLLVSSKLEDTLKKLREIQVAAYQVKSAQDGLYVPTEPDPQLLDLDRARLIGIERLILETISFNFNLRSNAAYATRTSLNTSSQNQDAFAFVLKFGCYLKADKDFIKRAFRMAIDVHRTPLPLSYPPHTIAAACLYLTKFFSYEDTKTGTDVPEFQGDWTAAFNCSIDDVEDICYGILDLFLAVASPTASKTSPSETLLPFQSPRDATAPNTNPQRAANLSAELTDVKISLRYHSAKRKSEEGDQTNIEDMATPSRRRRVESGAQTPASALKRHEVDVKERNYLGRDDVTVRFLWNTD